MSRFVVSIGRVGMWMLALLLGALASVVAAVESLIPPLRKRSPA